MSASSMNPDLLDRALAIAREAHHGQTRRHGAPYITHPVAVAELVKDLGYAVGMDVTPHIQAMALLHDVIEDSPIERIELEARFGVYVGRGVDLLTKVGKGDAAAAAYFRRLNREGDDALRLIKVCDRIHNLSELHLAPDLNKLQKTIDETLAHVVPLAAAAAPTVAPGLVAALHDGVRAAARAQRCDVPLALVRSAARTSTRVTGRVGREVPSGIYGIVTGTDEVQVRELILGGVAMLQLRAKGRADRDLLATAEEIGQQCREAGVRFVVNDRPDLAFAARADGVHVGQSDLPPRIVRDMLGSGALVGASSHTEPELVALAAEGSADLVAVGPVFLSPTKQGHAPVVGLEALARRCTLSTLPVVAIGGITTPERVADCARAGATLVAAVSALAMPDARAMTRRMSMSFEAARATRDALASSTLTLLPPSTS